SLRRDCLQGGPGAAGRQIELARPPSHRNRAGARPQGVRRGVAWRSGRRPKTMYVNGGAQERTRTSTPLRAPAPEAGASTNSATWALRRFWQAAALKGGRPALSIGEATGYRPTP